MLEDIKMKLKTKMNDSITIVINEGRNKKLKLNGKLENMYPNIFVVNCENKLYSFSYSDVLIKKIILK